jgi:hypothetical protein
MCATGYRYHAVLTIALALAFAGPASAGDLDDLDRAVARGVIYLKKLQAADGSWLYPGHAMGPTALAGLALLECGVSKNDPAVLKALEYVRDGATGNSNIVGASQTYDISLAILFLDRYGSARDNHLLESLTVRLIGGQNSQGAWSYTCPTINSDETQRLRKSIAETEERPRDKSRRPTVEDLPREIVGQLQQIQVAQPGGSPATSGDNSNTQFATLGLWVGRRHGLPVETALARIEDRFRLTQNVNDGGWGYQSGIINSTKDTMTCAGLLGLAAAYGYAYEKEARQTEKTSKKHLKQPANLLTDKNVRAGLIALSTYIGTPVNAAGLPKNNAGNLLNLNPGGAPAPAMASAPQINYYLLWSIERVAMAFDLNKIGNKDWYKWGVQLILANQQADGGWRGTYGDGGVDTCFALFFLRRSNFAEDLTANLHGRVRDPGEARLRAGDFVPPRDTGSTKSALTIGLQLPKTFGSADPETTPPASPLSQELIEATPQNEAAVLDKLRDSKGVIHTEALAEAIPRIRGSRKTKARDALAARLTRMSAATLRDKFKDADPEIRRAAILAAAMNEDKSFVPEIVNLLADPSPVVWHAAPVAFRLLTGKDMGIDTAASQKQREEGAKKWQSWWSRNNKKETSSGRNPA